jgi:hypothetical protein
MPSEFGKVDKYCLFFQEYLRIFDELFRECLRIGDSKNLFIGQLFIGKKKYSASE